MFFFFFHGKVDWLILVETLCSRPLYDSLYGDFNQSLGVYLADSAQATMPRGNMASTMACTFYLTLSVSLSVLCHIDVTNDSDQGKHTGFHFVHGNVNR